MTTTIQTLSNEEVLMSKSNNSAVSYKIESGIALPERTSRGVYASTISSMNTGDSIVCQKIGQVLSFRSAAKAAGCSVIAHKNDDGSYRIWKSDKPTEARPVQKKAAAPIRKAPTNGKKSGK